MTILQSSGLMERRTTLTRNGSSGRGWADEGRPDATTLRVRGPAGSYPHVKSIYGTILEMGISRMSVAPFDFSSGISVLTVALSTTVSMA